MGSSARESSAIVVSYDVSNPVVLSTVLPLLMVFSLVR